MFRLIYSAVFTNLSLHQKATVTPSWFCKFVTLSDDDDSDHHNTILHKIYPSKYKMQCFNGDYIL